MLCVACILVSAALIVLVVPVSFVRPGVWGNMNHGDRLTAGLIIADVESAILQLHPLALYRSHHLPRVLHISELHIVYALPCPSVQSPVRDWNRDAGAYQG